MIFLRRRQNPPPVDLQAVVASIASSVSLLTNGMQQLQQQATSSAPAAAAATGAFYVDVLPKVWLRGSTSVAWRVASSAIVHPKDVADTITKTARSFERDVGKY